uniref:Uncharacterized protein n=1 Tax=Anopheles minimus TaxID=112268 RepID=A0A182WNM2_9DIPT
MCFQQIRDGATVDRNKILIPPENGPLGVGFVDRSAGQDSFGVRCSAFTRRICLALFTFDSPREIGLMVVRD